MSASEQMTGAPAQAARCAHNKLLRLYDPYSCEDCSVCHIAPACGWMYHCVYDPTGKMTDLDFVNLEHELRKYGILDTRPKRSGSGRVFALNTKSFPEYISFNPGTPMSVTLPSGSVAVQSAPFSLPGTGSSGVKHGKQLATVPLVPNMAPKPTTTTYAKPPRSLFACDFRICHLCCPDYLARKHPTLPSVVFPGTFSAPLPEIDNPPVLDARALMQSDFNRNHGFYSQFPPEMIGERRESPSPSNLYHQDESYSQTSSAFGTSQTMLNATERVNQAEGLRDNDLEHFPVMHTGNAASNTGSCDNSTARRDRPAVDMDEESREKRAGRRLSKGRFFIE